MNDAAQNPEKPICRLLQAKDFPEIIGLMKKSNIPFGGLYSDAIYKALYRRALVDDKIVFGVAEYENKLIGMVIALIDWNRFWRSFLLRHPVLAMHIFSNRIMDKLGFKEGKKDVDPEKLKDIDQYLTTSISDRCWKDSSPQIAKAIFIAVDPDYRGLKVGYQLNRFRDTVFIERGVKRYDGWVEMYRIPQLHLLHKTGFLIEKRGDKFFVSKDL